MTDRPILFSPAMVRALLDGRKTQTRRIIEQPFDDDYYQGAIELHRDKHHDGVDWRFNAEAVGGGAFREEIADVRFAVGDRLYVREAWRADPSLEAVAPRDMEPTTVWYMANYGFKPNSRFRQGMHMPRWASRLTLLVTDVRVQRLHYISEEDALAEGMIFTDFGLYQPPGEMSVDGGKTFHPFKLRQHEGWHWGEAKNPGQCLGSARSAYANLWGHLNGPGSWDANPWVVAVSFTAQHRNIDAPEVLS